MSLLGQMSLCGLPFMSLPVRRSWFARRAQLVFLLADASRAVSLRFWTTHRFDIVILLVVSVNFHVVVRILALNVYTFAGLLKLSFNLSREDANGRTNLTRHDVAWDNVAKNVLLHRLLSVEFLDYTQHRFYASVY